jgi:F0F1-type ATP synthase assembly protein I
MVPSLTPSFRRHDVIVANTIMNMAQRAVRHVGISSALGTALLFGISAPLAKMLLGQTSPWLLAALLYLGSGLGLWLVRRFQRAQPVTLAWRDWAWLALWC